MSELTGANFIGFSQSKLSDKKFHSYSPKDNRFLPDWFYWATQHELNSAATLAQTSFSSCQKFPMISVPRFWKR